MTGARTHAVALRAKTGCKTCRTRRRKCDETRPSCLACTASKRHCVYPTGDDLIDGRFAVARARKISGSSAAGIDHGLHAQARISHLAIQSSLEQAVGRHFDKTYFSLLINPDSHPIFHRDWIDDIHARMVTCSSVKYSVLANAASNLYLAGEAGQMREVALQYYSNSLQGLTRTVMRAPSTSLNERNSILTSILMLYLHGCMGHGTHNDTSMHINAAIKLIKLNYLSSTSTNPGPTLKSPIDRLVVESVMYHMFLQRMGLWSVDADNITQSSFDPEFWLSCEALLSRSVLYPGQSRTYNSPVLGIPSALHKIMMRLRQLWETAAPSSPFRVALHGLHCELSHWEKPLRDLQAGPILPVASTDQPSSNITQDATAMMLLSAGLLLDHLLITERRIRPAPASDPTWHLDGVVRILRRRAGDITWLTSYLGNYPLYVAGHFMRTMEEIGLVREELRLRYQFTAFSQVLRFSEDLETAWRSRGEVHVDTQQHIT